jgi:hypothetical protein
MPDTSQNWGDQLSGGSGQAGWISNLGGLSGSGNNLLSVERDGAGAVTRSVDRRAAATTALALCASAASGAATFSQAAGPIAGAVGTAVGMVSTALTGGFTAYDGQKAIAQLKAIQASLSESTSVQWTQDLKLVADALDYCISKQTVKRNKGVADATLLGQPVNAIYKGGRAVVKFAKGTKGANRAMTAETLVQIAKKNVGTAPKIARRMIEIIAAQNFESVLTNAVADALKSG